jgi:DNA-binding NarL/FixJ family response regulator
MTLTSEELLRAVRAAATGGGALPPQLVGEVLNQLRQLRRGPVTRGNTRSPLTTREADVLRLLADGYDTVEIASRLQYSERTIKNIIHSLLQRLGLRNRPHAVAYAMRAGLID